MRIFCLLITASFFAYTQDRPPLHEFLDLTPEQVAAINQNNQSYNDWAQQKQQRIFQVQGEIAEWTAAEPIDPSQLGVRYAEIEAICRRMVNESRLYRQKNLEALTEEQKAKLAALKEVLRLYPVAASASTANLIGESDAPTAIFALNRWFNTGAFIGVSVVSGCRPPVVPTAAMRAGDFSNIQP